VKGCVFGFEAGKVCCTCFSFGILGIEGCLGGCIWDLENNVVCETTKRLCANRRVCIFVEGYNAGDKGDAGSDLDQGADPVDLGSIHAEWGKFREVLRETRHVRRKRLVGVVHLDVCLDEEDIALIESPVRVHLVIKNIPVLDMNMACVHIGCLFGEFFS